MKPLRTGAAPATRRTRSGGSRRSQVLALIHAEVERLGRAVRATDIAERAAVEYAGSPALANLSLTLITRSISSLVQTGDVVVIATARGGAAMGGGTNLVIPANLDHRAQDYLPREPLTWFELVIDVFSEAWAESLEKAQAAGRPPAPVRTMRLREILRARGGHARLSDPQLLINALRNIEASPDSPVRQIAGRRALWVPSHVSDEELSLASAFGSDPERVAEAVRRAMRRTGLPAVPRAQIACEMRSDPELRPNAPLYVALSDASRRRMSEGRRTARAQRPNVLIRAGRADRTSYYAVRPLRGRGEWRTEARRFVSFLRLRYEVDRLNAAGELDRLAESVIPTAATGRARLLVASLNDALARLAQIGDAPILGIPQIDRSSIARDIHRQLERADRWLRFRTPQDDDELPCEVSTDTPGWTDRELYDAYRLVCPRADRLKSTIEMTRYVGKYLPRVPNPEFVSQGAPHPRHSVRFLFDRTGALLYAARHWGGREARIHAAAADRTLGSLRDARFVLPGLRSSQAWERLAAVSCLAFLAVDEATQEALAGLSCTDTEAGIRQVALWAYGFTGGPRTTELLWGAERDSSNLVREFAREALRRAEEPWLSL